MQPMEAVGHLKSGQSALFVEITNELERTRVEGGPAYVYVGQPQYCMHDVRSRRLRPCAQPLYPYLLSDW
jgi:hypothetical protein